MSSRALPARLRSLVRVVEAALGDVIREAEGSGVFDAIEGIRRSMVTFREARAPAARRRALEAARRRLDRATARDRHKLARAHTLYLELVNACENAYRTHRLRERDKQAGGGPAEVIFVLTAHPTESRSPQNIRLLRRLQCLLIESSERGVEPDRERLHHLLRLLWRVGTHPPHRPTVADEARHLYSLVSDEILDELIDLAGAGQVIRLRSWVGGDKDGHPGVGAREMARSFQLSRDRLIGFAAARIEPSLSADATLLGDVRIASDLRPLRDDLLGLRRLRPGDAERVKRLRRSAARLDRTWRARLGRGHPSLGRLAVLLDLFPGLVIPLELREERGRFGRRSAIAAMLRRAVALARGGALDAYLGGVVVSMTKEPADLIEACALVASVTGGPNLPVVPLFELPDSLDRAVEILAGAWRDRSFRQTSRRHGGRIEVMLGYSDTSKRMGVLASRLAIADTMQAIGDWGRRERARIVFFHGAGGSVGRGGGTIADRAAGWPSDFLSPHKETVQGEMVERTLATPEILRSNAIQIAAVQAKPPAHVPPGPLIRRLAEESRKAFVELVGMPELRRLLAAATPYERLGTLTIGSRPASRGSAGGMEQLRAIPWVLCWTQTRYLAHGWLGIGTAWRRVRREPGAVARLRREMRRDPLLRAYLRGLGFTLAKTAPTLWDEYVRTLSPRTAPALVRRLERERRDALDLARSGSPDGELLFDRRWLLESIRHRAPMIHPLNLLQIGTLARARDRRPRRDDEDLFRETVTGIAAGMLTTG